MTCDYWYLFVYRALFSNLKDISQHQYLSNWLRFMIIIYFHYCFASQYPVSSLSILLIHLRQEKGLFKPACAGSDFLVLTYYKCSSTKPPQVKWPSGPQPDQEEDKPETKVKVLRKKTGGKGGRREERKKWTWEWTQTKVTFHLSRLGLSGLNFLPFCLLVWKF